MIYIKIFAAIFLSIYFGILPTTFSQHLEINKLEPTLLPNYFFDNFGLSLNYGGGKLLGLTRGLDSLVELDIVNGSKKIILGGLPTKQYKCFGGIFPINRIGNLLFEPSFAEIFKLKNKKVVGKISVRNSLKNEVPEDDYNGETIRPYINDKVGSKNHFVFGLSCRDSLTINMPS